MIPEPLVSLRAECERLVQARWPEGTSLVFGEGNATRPPLMLIGEAPGEQEARQGKPFVGKAGKNLTAFLKQVELRREDLYISNTVKLRPSKVSAAGRTVNRPPTREEIAFFLPWLIREIGLVQPRALVTLGNVPLKALAGWGETIGACHGCWREIRIPAEDARGITLPLFPLYHPASVLYNRALEAVYQEDLQALCRTLKR